jgi:hypothetical protein
MNNKPLAKNQGDKTTKKILIAITMVSIIILAVLYDFGVILDKNFFIETLKAIFANTLVFFIAIFCIDMINKNEQKEKLKLLNVQISNFIFLKSTALVCSLGEQIGIFDTNALNEIYRLLISESKVTDATKNILNNHILFTEKFYESYADSKDKQLFISKFIETSKEFLEVIQKNLEKIYPHQSSEMTSLTEKIFFCLGAMEAPNIMSKSIKSFRESEEYKKINTSEEEWEKFVAGYEHLEKFIYSTTAFVDHTESFFKGLNLLRNKARENKLFSDI